MRKSTTIISAAIITLAVGCLAVGLTKQVEIEKSKEYPIITEEQATLAALECEKYKIHNKYRTISTLYSKDNKYTYDKYTPEDKIALSRLDEQIAAITADNETAVNEKKANIQSN